MLHLEIDWHPRNPFFGIIGRFFPERDRTIKALRESVRVQQDMLIYYRRQISYMKFTNENADIEQDEFAQSLDHKEDSQRY